MPIATGLALGLAAASIGGSVAGSALQSNAAGKAANAQVNAANYAAELQHEDAQAGLDFEKQQYADTQKIEAPYISAGTSALGSLQDLLSGKVTPNEQNDPGIAFRLQQGEQALNRSAAARGNLLTGGTAKALTEFGQNYGSNEFNNIFNRYATVAGFGQNSAATQANAGNNSAGQVANTLLTSGQQQSNDIQNAAAARASGYASQGNIWGSTLGNIGGDLTQTILLKELLGKQGGSGVIT